MFTLITGIVLVLLVRKREKAEVNIGVLVLAMLLDYYLIKWALPLILSQ